jgi:hypothetical protein
MKGHLKSRRVGEKPAVGVWSMCGHFLYYLYILKCKDGTLYTGITVDLDRRVEEHNSSKRGAVCCSLGGVAIYVGL